jgi:hypothetical protein
MQLSDSNEQPPRVDDATMAPAAATTSPTPGTARPTEDPVFCRSCYPEFEFPGDAQHAKSTGVYVEDTSGQGGQRWKLHKQDWQGKIEHGPTEQS